MCRGGCLVLFTQLSSHEPSQRDPLERVALLSWLAEPKGDAGVNESPSLWGRIRPLSSSDDGAKYASEESMRALLTLPHSCTLILLAVSMMNYIQDLFPSVISYFYSMLKSKVCCLLINVMFSNTFIFWHKEGFSRRSRAKGQRERWYLVA